VIFERRDVLRSDPCALQDVARQFTGHCRSMTSRCLHEIEFFSDLVSSEAEVVFIGQSKEISRHGLGQRSPRGIRTKNSIARPAILMAAGLSFGGWPSRAAKARLSRMSMPGTHTRSTRADPPPGQSSPPRPLWLCIADMQSPCPLEGPTRHTQGIQMHSSCDNPPACDGFCIGEKKHPNSQEPSC
jgi:hypothetical protein